MKKFVTLLVTLLVIASLSFCAVAEEKPFAGQTLTISTFSFNAELLQKNIYDPFDGSRPARPSSWIDSGRNAGARDQDHRSPRKTMTWSSSAICSSISSWKRACLIRLTPASCQQHRVASMRAPARRWARAMARRTPSTVSALSMTAAFCDVEIKSWADLWNPELADSIADAGNDHDLRPAVLLRDCRCLRP